MPHAAAVHDVEVDPQQLRLAVMRFATLGSSPGRTNATGVPPPTNSGAFCTTWTPPLAWKYRWAALYGSQSRPPCAAKRFTRSDGPISTPTEKTVLIHDRKDPRKKEGNHQLVPLVSFTGFDAWKLLEEQREWTRLKECCFPAAKLD